MITYRDLVGLAHSEFLTRIQLRVTPPACDAHSSVLLKTAFTRLEALLKSTQPRIQQLIKVTK
jgi:hypothetical protein